MYLTRPFPPLSYNHPPCSHRSHRSHHRTEQPIPTNTPHPSYHFYSQAGPPEIIHTDYAAQRNAILTEAAELGWTAADVRGSLLDLEIEEMEIGGEWVVGCGVGVPVGGGDEAAAAAAAADDDDDVGMVPEEALLAVRGKKRGMWEWEWVKLGWGVVVERKGDGVMQVFCRSASGRGVGGGLVVRDEEDVRGKLVDTTAGGAHGRSSEGALLLVKTGALACRRGTVDFV